MTERDRRRDQDEYKALAAGVIARAMREFEGTGTNYQSGRTRAEVRADAAHFLQGDMAPFADVLGFDPETDLSHRKWCRAHGLVAGKYSEGNDPCPPQT